jgi:hypothetical protein
MTKLTVEVPMTHEQGLDIFFSEDESVLQPFRDKFYDVGIFDFKWHFRREAFSMQCTLILVFQNEMDAVMAKLVL